MRILIDPSELSIDSLLPQLPDSQPSPGLEALTGADFAIAYFPLPLTEATLKAHIQAGTIFVQRKSGFDFIGDFEQIWREIARAQATKIPASQFYVLAIGHYKPDDNGLLRITGRRPLENNKKLTYKTFLKIQEQLFCSGVRVVQLNDESEIEAWIEAITETRQDIKERNGRKEIFVNGEVALYEPQHEPDYLQEVIEVPDDDIRYFLACGLKGFGQQTANNLVEYCKTEAPHLSSFGIYALKILTDLDAKGKPVYKVPGWGKKSIEKFRQVLGLPNGYNLDVREIEVTKGFVEGWRQGLLSFKDLMEKGVSGKDAWESLIKQANELMEF